MAQVQKGVVTQFENGLPVVRPFGSGDALTPPLEDRRRACGSSALCTCNGAICCPIGGLSVGDVVTFVVFEDGTGVVLAEF